VLLQQENPFGEDVHRQFGPHRDTLGLVHAHFGGGRHPAAITFHVLSGTGVWQEDGKPPITLHAGDSLFVAAGTIHSHWNPSATEQLRFLEFIVAAKGEGRSIPQPLKN
jgi:hypothetical protein